MSAGAVTATANYFDGQYVSDISPTWLVSVAELCGYRAPSARGAVFFRPLGSPKVSDPTPCERRHPAGKSLLDRGFRRLYQRVTRAMNAIVVFQDRAITKGYGAGKLSDCVPLIIAVGCARNFG